jgi:hypothetical protein
MIGKNVMNSQLAKIPVLGGSLFADGKGFNMSSKKE